MLHLFAHVDGLSEETCVFAGSPLYGEAIRLSGYPGSAPASSEFRRHVYLAATATAEPQPGDGAVERARSCSINLFASSPEKKWGIAAAGRS
jgi:hypothetical protein